MAQTAPPEIAESEATGDLAALFADIREVTGRPAVNLLFRTLAAEPGALAWSWNLLRPAYRAGVLDDAGDKLIVDPPPVRPLDRSTLAANGIDQNALNTIRTILSHYNSGNRSTIVALAVLRQGLEQPCQVVAPAGGGLQPATYALPPLLAVDQMDAGIRDVVIDLSGRLSGGRAVAVPGMYRHLAHWPQFLALIATALAPLFEDGSISSCIEAVQRQADECGMVLISQAPPATFASVEFRDAVSAITAEFRHKVAEMLVIGLLLEAMLPRGTP